jgi:aspartate kinase
MKVFKLGGGILNSADTIGRIPVILDLYPDDDLLLVVSAFGKTTNALEDIASARYSGRNWSGPAESLKQWHYLLSKELLPQDNECFILLDALFKQLALELSLPASGNFDRDYDQVVGYGEQFSSLIVHHYLSEAGYPNILVDARRFILTDSNHRAARVDLAGSSLNAAETLAPLFRQAGGSRKVAVTQGFIGATADGLPTTLGREGSDYSAAIFASLLDAEEVTIWKDVPGVLNADPARFSDTVKLERISYAEATELAFYGAKVLHPKTTKPLQNKNIPLKVRSFTDLGDPGTRITNTSGHDGSIPSFIIKENQDLVTISAKDLSFISQAVLLDVLSAISSLGLTMNIIQNSALTLSVCLDHSGKLDTLVARLQDKYFIRYNTGLELLTIRHYTPDALATAISGREVLLEQQNRTVAQFIVRQV